MASKKGKIQFLDKKGRVVKTGTLTTEIPTADIEPEFEKPLVSVTVSNPFKKILYWLNQIRKHQTTTFAFKLSIPLIALPVLVFAVFQVGRNAGISFQKAKDSPTPAAQASPTLQTVEISRAGTLKVAKGTQTRYLVQLRNGEIVNLQIPENINLTKYANKQVLVTGIQNKTTGVINVSDIAEIEVFNITQIDEPSPTSSPGATPSTNLQQSSPSAI